MFTHRQFRQSSCGRTWFECRRRVVTCRRELPTRLCRLEFRSTRSMARPSHQDLKKAFFDENIGKWQKLLTSAHIFLGLRAEWRAEHFCGVWGWQPLPTLVQANDFHFHVLEIRGSLSRISFVAPAAIKNVDWHFAINLNQLAYPDATANVPFST